MEWPQVELGRIAEIRGGATPRRDNPAYWDGNIAWLTPTDLPANGIGVTDVATTQSYITEEGLASCSASVLPPGTVLFSSRASIGKLGIAAVPLATNQGFANFIPRPGVESRYLAWCLHFHADRIAGLAGSTTFKEVSKSSIRRFTIPLPAPSEQLRIVEILDQADRLRRLRAEADTRAGRIPRAIFKEMFGDPLTNPIGWPIRRLDSIAESRLGKMLDARQQTGLHPRPYLRNANVYWDRLDLEDLLEMDFDESDQEEFRLRRGDVLICEGGEVGRCAIWNEEIPDCYFQKALHRVRPLPDAATPEFIVYLLWEMADRGALLESVSKVTFSHLTGVKLKALPVPVPPLPLQQRFGTLVQRFKQSARHPEVSSRIDSLFELIVSRAFSGSLTASWREGHMNELFQEMEEQAKTLAEAG